MATCTTNRGWFRETSARIANEAVAARTSCFDGAACFFELFENEGKPRSSRLTDTGPPGLGDETVCWPDPPKLLRCVPPGVSLRGVSKRIAFANAVAAPIPPSATISLTACENFGTRKQSRRNSPPRRRKAEQSAPTACCADRDCLPETCFEAPTCCSLNSSRSPHRTSSKNARTVDGNPGSVRSFSFSSISLAPGAENENNSLSACAAPRRATRIAAASSSVFRERLLLSEHRSFWSGIGAPTTNPSPPNANASTASARRVLAPRRSRSDSDNASSPAMRVRVAFVGDCFALSNGTQGCGAAREVPKRFSLSC
mmetsp:Transcript_5599/g.21195  ORF Transcript_5599/g.21195 Transcript_5599/m.21195 type:complete len:314 (-) Transcript_5599:3033-3974(-)